MSTVILPGFHPDPTICRVGERYYLATSTFEYAPGVPLFSSDDLVTWTPIGNALDRPSQLEVRTGLSGASGGIYAPTLRHHDGLFWLVTTNIHQIAQGHLIVHAENPTGPWSEPVFTSGLLGIDPDLFWDEAGVCHLSWSDVVRGGISQAVVDPRTGEVQTEPVQIWSGTGGAHAEGPHLFRRGDWCYLLVAEGGTAAGHMVTVARSKSIAGPFESNPANPILTHRSTSQSVQATGHADLVERPDGSWALVHLGTRPRGSFPKWHTNGRETFLAGVDWVDDWPVVVEDRFAPVDDGAGFVDTFQAEQLHHRWISPGAHPAAFAHPGTRGLTLDAGRMPDDIAARALLAVRAQHASWRVTVEGTGDLALSVRIDDAHQAIVERIGGSVRVRAVIGPVAQTLVQREDAPEVFALSITALPVDARPGERQGPDRLVLALGDDELAEIDGRYISTEVAGGFTGRVIGIEAIGASATVSRFHYETL